MLFSLAWLDLYKAYSMTSYTVFKKTFFFNSELNSELVSKIYQGYCE